MVDPGFPTREGAPTPADVGRQPIWQNQLPEELINILFNKVLKIIIKIENCMKL